jgi:hypothetical protein
LLTDPFRITLSLVLPDTVVTMETCRPRPMQSFRSAALPPYYISVFSGLMSFGHQGLAFNLLDTPDQQDFSLRRFQLTEFQQRHLAHPAAS